MMASKGNGGMGNIKNTSNRYANQGIRGVFVLWGSIVAIFALLCDSGMI